MKKIYTRHLEDLTNPSRLCISRSYIKIEINVNLYFLTSLWCLKRFFENFWLNGVFTFIPLCGTFKGFIKNVKTFMKPLEAPLKGVRIKTLFNLKFSKMPLKQSIWWKICKFTNDLPKVIVLVNPSRSDLGRGEKTTVKFYFHYSFWCNKVL